VISHGEAAQWQEESVNNPLERRLPHQKSATKHLRIFKTRRRESRVVPGQGTCGPPGARTQHLRIKSTNSPCSWPAVRVRARPLPRTDVTSRTVTAGGERLGTHQKCTTNGCDGPGLKYGEISRSNDDNGNVKTITDAEDFVTRIVYAALNRSIDASRTSCGDRWNRDAPGKAWRAESEGDEVSLGPPARRRALESEHHA
jgi:hypothetical protein